MIHRSSHRAVRCLSFVTPPLCLAILFCAAGITFAAVVGDQVELKATQQAGVPLHQQARGTNDFQRVPDGTRRTVLEVAPDGRWLRLSLPDGRTGWVTSRYVSQPATGTPSPGTSPLTIKPQHIEEGIVERVADGDTITVIAPNQTKLRIRMFGIDAPETPRALSSPASLMVRRPRPISNGWSKVSASGWKSMGWTAISGCSQQCSSMGKISTWR
jgi:hypothetical protein